MVKLVMKMLQKNKAYQYLWDTSKAALKKKLIALNTSVEEKKKISNQ